MRNQHCRLERDENSPRFNKASKSKPQLTDVNNIHWHAQ